MSFRGFISADIQPSERLVNILNDLAATRADIKVVKPGLLHVTLKFLGQTEENLVPEIESRMGRACSGIAPFTIQLKGMGAFPSLSNIRVVWVGIENGEPLGKIAGMLEDSTAELGFAKEKRGFLPHLTLARMRSGRNMQKVQEILKANAAAEFGEYPIDRVSLKKSVLSPQGPSYSTVHEQRLQ
jgi:2'-5' RNA ligase